MSEQKERNKVYMIDFMFRRRPLLIDTDGNLEFSDVDIDELANDKSFSTMGSLDKVVTAIQQELEEIKNKEQ